MIVAAVFVVTAHAGVALGPESPRVLGGSSQTPLSGRVAVLSYTRGSVSSWLEVASLSGGDRSAVTRVPRKGERRSVEEPVWSPDGSKLAYLFHGKSFKRRSLYVVNADGTGRHRLARWKQVGIIARAGIVWAPDSGRLVFSATQREFNQRPSDPAL